MRSAEPRAARKALAGLLRFLGRDGASGPAPADAAGRITLLREDGASRPLDSALLRAALARGLAADGPAQPGEARGGAVRLYRTTPEGRAALRRWLADPESAFQDQHRSLAAASDPDLGALTVNLAESPLAALARLRGKGGEPFLSPAEVAAGERLRVDFTRAGMLPGLGQRWEPVRAQRQPGGAGGVAELTDAALQARQRTLAALAAVGPELSGVLLDLCCFLKGLADVERERQWPARSAKLMLRTALAALARHYEAPRRRDLRPRSAPPPHAP
ncbi:DUF6456 domain-containing protein [Hoeflea olei]|uniref:DUF6456 domain-containing protein n=1 Tax=Hoeflea olei TaxID=1480615 RepID=A0A1C1YQI5_9HYPH|nr:DUF6456 domain-containing protein [Hoeflea olei]OCW55744.1 hypothetical protein AWJ14_14760 [Hoeflea olei]